jgi:hypothetical protein
MQRNRLVLKRDGKVSIVWNEVRIDFVAIPK